MTHLKSLFLFFLLALGATPLAAKELPVEVFFKNYEFTRVTLSPDGKYLAAIAPYKGSRNLVVIDRATHKSRPVTSLTKHDVSSYQWASNDRLIFSVEADGNESNALYAVNADGTRPKQLTEASRGVQLIPRYTRVIDRLREDDRHVLVLSNKRRLLAPDIYKMNIYTGRKQRLTTNPGDITNWVLDWDHQPRAAVREKVDRKHEQVTTEILYRDHKGAPWQVVASFKLGEEEVMPLGFTPDNRRLWLLSAQGRDKLALYEWDPASGRRKLVFGRNDVDLAGGAFSPKDHRLLAVSYETDKPQVHYLDPKFDRLQKALDKALPDRLNRILSLTDDEKAAIVLATSDRTPGTWYLFELEPRPKLTYLAQVEERIDPKAMVPMEPITFKARDGLEIHGYLTRPRNARGPLPLIIHPHGGPYGVRDVWGWNPEVQFLANRGYAVLQVNYRGSGGYGHQFEVGAWKQWGLKMQDDLNDALRWAVDQGIADPKRVCIYGASYGGYATMAGLTRDPDLYRCGIDYVGVVDLFMLEKWDRRWDKTGALTAWFHHAVGDPDDPDDRARMAATSPIRHLDRLDDPLFVIHGRRDPRVEIKQAERLIDRLDALGKPYVKLIKKKEGHGFRREENRLELYRMMDAFLKKHL